jgi:transcription initiation factor TFIIF subunit beta
LPDFTLLAMSQSDTKPSINSNQASTSTSGSSSAPTYPFPVDPSEELAVDPNKANKNIWAVRIPRFLLERWERVTEAGIELGTLVVDNS